MVITLGVELLGDSLIRKSLHIHLRDGCRLGFGLVEVVVKILHGLVFLQQSLVVAQQLLVLSLVIHLLRELLEVDGMATVDGRHGPWGVIDCGCLIGADCMQIIDPAG